MLADLLVRGLAIIGVSLSSSSPRSRCIFVILALMEVSDLSIGVRPIPVHLLVIIINKLVVVGLSLVVEVVYFRDIGFYGSLRRCFLAAGSILIASRCFREGLRRINSVGHHLVGSSFLIESGKFLLLTFDLLAKAVESGIHLLQVMRVLVSFIHLCIIEWSTSVKSKEIRHLIIRKTLVPTRLQDLSSLVSPERHGIVLLRLQLVLREVLWSLLGIIYVLFLVAHVKRYSLCSHRGIFSRVWILKSVRKGVTS